MVFYNFSALILIQKKSCKGGRGQKGKRIVPAKYSELIDMAKSYKLLRLLIPRRLSTTINVVLVLILSGLILFVVIREFLGRETPTLPPGESKTWPSVMPEVHIKPDPGIPSKG
jgi:hypothetical protein